MQRILSRAFPSTSSALSTNTPFMIDRRPPPDLGKWANFKRFLWNKEKRTFCNRTFSSWCKILCFYCLFLMFMIGLFFIILLGATNYIKRNCKTPCVDKTNIIIGGSPGIGFLPNIIKTASPLIWYATSGDVTSHTMRYRYYVKYITKYMIKYDKATLHPDKYVDCSKENNKSKFCIFLKTELGPCGTNTFGYKEKKPCIYIKINKIPKWKPQYYKENDVLPKHMPESLKKQIQQSPDKEILWIHCEGLFPSDVEHIGKLSYFPQQGIKGYYFPYIHHPNYLTPLVAVKIDNVKLGYVINIRCSVWAKNIEYINPNTHSTYVQLYLARD